MHLTAQSITNLSLSCSVLRVAILQLVQVIVSFCPFTVNVLITSPRAQLTAVHVEADTAASKKGRRFCAFHDRRMVIIGPAQYAI